MTITNSGIHYEAADADRLGSLFQPLRVCDVADALDGIGYFNLTLMNRDIRPLWSGMKFWGHAATMRCVPANRPMWKLDSTEDIVNAHGLWFKEMGHVKFQERLDPGHVIVTDSGGGPEVGMWGSENAMGAIAGGAVGIVSDGFCRDTGEIELQRTPVCVRERGRTIIPGRIEVVEVQSTIACGGVQVRPGDIVGADDDGVLVVPAEVAHDVATHARGILFSDMNARRKHYDKLGKPVDPSVDIDAMERYFASV